ncbi:MAG: S9 family peptidase [Crocinitomicaceae bacterium]|nr:S9 family peptidase [Crocinitomicaceae bacterium]
MKKLFLLIPSLLAFLTLIAQENTPYQKPSKEISDLALADTPPYPFFLKEKKKMVLLYRKKYKSIEELADKEIRLAGLRLNPDLKISSRQTYYYDLAIQNVGSKEIIKVKGLPENCRIANLSLSPDENYMTFLIPEKGELKPWILDIEKAEASKIKDVKMSASMGSAMRWFTDSENLLLQIDPGNLKLTDPDKSIPTGPVISNSNGSKAQNRTYQDLLKNKVDEDNFTALTTSKLMLYNIKSKEFKPFIEEEAIYSRVSMSPDNKYLLVESINKPFSYLVPYYRFPSKTIIYDRSGKKISLVMDKPLTEELPKGTMAVRTGMRNINWRPDKPATLTYIEAMDGGDPEKEVEFRDGLYQIEAPFNGKGKLMVQTINRIYSIDWANDNLAIVHDYWWNTRNTKSYKFNPSNPNEKPKILWDRNYQDAYSDPGSFISEENDWNRDVLVTDGDYLYMEGDGQTEEGKKPFISKYNIKTGKMTKVFEIQNKNEYKSIRRIIDVRSGEILTSKESPTEYPNYYLENIKTKKRAQQITFFENPFKSFEGVTKQLVKYKRDDGIELSATLYIPEGHLDKKEGKLPMLMWAYPREFKDKSSAGQVSGDPNEFNYIWYGSPLFWAAKGYVVMDETAFPIIGEGDDEPNDTFLKQLVANAKAAIDYVDSLGYIDRTKVAVGGHSYGAFMTANLLTHSDLFAAGIARSGAYNRTLTPFGFQSEERSYWEAPEIYNTMSPFMSADQMKNPLLIIHGQADNNSGTYPMQSERYFNALKGHGATARLVMLPLESHGYAAEESILHMLWEQEEWLKKYCGK